MLAVPVLAGSTAFALAEAIGWREGLERKVREARGFYAVIAGSMLLGLVLNFVGLNPIRALYFAAILNGLAAPPLILLMFVLSNSKETLGDRTGGKLSNILLAAAFLVMAGLPIAFLVA